MSTPGFYIAVDRLLAQVDQGVSIDVYGVVYNMLHHRRLIIKNEVPYCICQVVTTVLVCLWFCPYLCLYMYVMYL